MIILAAFLAGISFVVAIAACMAVHAERQRAEKAAAVLQAALTEQANCLVGFAKQLVVLENTIRAVAAASVPPTIPYGQVHIIVPGPRTPQ